MEGTLRLNLLLLLLLLLLLGLLLVVGPVDLGQRMQRALMPVRALLLIVLLLRAVLLLLPCQGPAVENLLVERLRRLHWRNGLLPSAALHRTRPSSHWSTGSGTTNASGSTSSTGSISSTGSGTSRGGGVGGGGGGGGNGGGCGNRGGQPGTPRRRLNRPADLDDPFGEGSGAAAGHGP
jgi:hypothetical protein